MTGAALLLFLTSYVAAAEQVVVTFEDAVPLLADKKANRIPKWEEKGVTFTLAREPENQRRRAC